MDSADRWLFQNQEVGAAADMLPIGHLIHNRKQVHQGRERLVERPLVGRMTAAMSIAGPAYRLTLDHLHQLSNEVIRVTQMFSHQLGYIGKVEG